MHKLSHIGNYDIWDSNSLPEDLVSAEIAIVDSTVADRGCYPVLNDASRSDWSRSIFTLGVGGVASLASLMKIALGVSITFDMDEDYNKDGFFALKANGTLYSDTDVALIYAVCGRLGDAINTGVNDLPTIMAQLIHIPIRVDRTGIGMYTFSVDAQVIHPSSDHQITGSMEERDFVFAIVIENRSALATALKGAVDLQIIKVGAANGDVFLLPDTYGN